LKKEQKLTEAEIWYNPKEFEPYLKKIGLKFPKYPKQGDVTKDGKVVGHMDNFNGFSVYSQSLLKQLQKVANKYKLGIWNPTSGVRQEQKLREGVKLGDVREELEYAFEWDYVEQEGADSVRFDWGRGRKSMWVHKNGKASGEIPKDNHLKKAMKKLRIKEGMGEQKLREDYKNSEWIVYVADENYKEKVVKKAKSKRAAVILYNKLINTDKYHEVGMRVVKEQKLREAIRKIIDEDFAGAYPEHQRKKFDGKRRKQSEVLGYKLTGKDDVRTEIDDATVKEGVAGGLTYKKGKTVTVTHKTSGKELVIIDKPNVRKEYEKIGYFVGRKGYYEGNITEKKESAIDVAKRIVKDKQYEQGVDMQTANLILKIYNAYDKHPALQKKFEKLPLKKMAQNVWRFVK
jgi:hypothetical protein